jgi:hypothetical protein
MAEVGFALLLDCSGSLFRPKAPHPRDVEANSEIIYAVIKVSRGIGRYTALHLKAAILKFYGDNKLFPTGLSAGMEVVDTWALKQADALQRLVTRIYFKSGLL